MKIALLTDRFLPGDSEYELLKLIRHEVGCGLKDIQVLGPDELELLRSGLQARIGLMDGEEALAQGYMGASFEKKRQALLHLFQRLGGDLSQVGVVARGQLGQQRAGTLTADLP